MQAKLLTPKEQARKARNNQIRVTFDKLKEDFPDATDNRLVKYLSVAFDLSGTMIRNILFSHDAN